MQVPGLQPAGALQGTWPVRGGETQARFWKQVAFIFPFFYLITEVWWCRLWPACAQAACYDLYPQEQK